MRFTPRRSRPAARRTAIRAALGIDQGYYAAFVRDPEGNKIEAVTFTAADR